MNLKQVVINGQKLNVGGGSGGSSEPLDIYSTEEKRIGMWIDGKPLYRRVVTGTLGVDVIDNGYHRITTIENLDTCVSCNGFIYHGVYSYMREFIPNTAIYIGWSMNGDITAYEAATGFSNKEVVLILEYTKTTDQPEQK